MNEADDRALVEAARAALERSAASHREAADVTGSWVDPEWVSDHATLAEQATECARRLADLDPAERLDAAALDALVVGGEALAREAAGWHYLAATATEQWRGEFTARSEQAQQNADAVLALRQRLFERDRGAEQEAER